MTDLLVPLCLYVGIFRNIWQRLLLFLFDLIYSVSMATAAVSLFVAARLTLNMCSICWLVICSNSMARFRLWADPAGQCQYPAFLASLPLA